MARERHAGARLACRTLALEVLRARLAFVPLAPRFNDAGPLKFRPRCCDGQRSYARTALHESWGAVCQSAYSVLGLPAYSQLQF